MSIKVQAGDHVCDEPVIFGDAINEAYWRSRSTKYRWKCSECGSRHVGSIVFECYWPGGNGRYQRGIEWRRVTPSSRRWKRAERQRIGRVAEVSTDTEPREDEA